MAKIAIAMLVVFFGLAGLVRIAIQLRRTGKTGLIGLRRDAGLLDWLSGILFIGGMAMGIASPILVLNDALDPIDALDFTALNVVGIVVAGTAGIAVFAAQLGMGESWRIGVSDEERTDLVTGGWFSLVRNPIYSAMIGGWTGLALMVPTWLGLTAIAVVFVGLELQVRAVEEPYLVRTHGDEFRRYTSRVGRFFPGVGRFG
jgi:protein-S-isoprenylcysteine O-methyltransferase Ste14